MPISFNELLPEPKELTVLFAVAMVALPVLDIAPLTCRV